MKEETTTEETIETTETRIIEEKITQRETIGTPEEVITRIESQIIERMIAETEEINGNMIREMIGGVILETTQIIEKEVM
jgi:hypothetical protein